MFDKVMVLYEGRQIYFGKTGHAKQYFEDLGFECKDIFRFLFSRPLFSAMMLIKVPRSSQADCPGLFDLDDEP
jgi:hypothetical protein